MATRFAINGFGRIGRCVARALHESGRDDLELVAINDLTDAATLAHLLAFDSVHGRFANTPVSSSEKKISYGGKDVQVLAERDPAKLPWKELDVEIVLECTGLFRDRQSAGQHIEAGAERVIISAPGQKVDATFCVGINSEEFDASAHKVVSNASCTTNCLAPLVKVLHDKFGIVKGHMVTVHSYTNDQRLLDLPHKDLRRARAASLSMIPSTTGAAKAIGLVIPELNGKLDGTSIRVPTPNVSLTCLTAQVAKKTDRDAVNAAFQEAARGKLEGILGVEERPLVSMDFRGDARSSIVDAAQTQVVEGDLVEVQSWYDNEWGFSSRLLDLTRVIAKAS